MSNTCADCHWYEEKYPTVIWKGKNMGSLGECRRFAPNQGFPEINSTSFCGDFKEREKKQKSLRHLNENQNL